MEIVGQLDIIGEAFMLIQELSLFSKNGAWQN